MVEAERLSNLMALRDLSQSELARRVGVSQATIFKLVSGRIYGTKHLHKIARELGTTPAYLEGEIDDPDADASEVPELDAESRALILQIKELAPADRRALLQIARSMAAGGATPSDTVHDNKRGIRGKR